MIITYNNGNQIKKADSYESEEKSDTLILGIYDPKESKYKTEESKYDAFNQLIEVKGSVNAEYKYRPDGLRLSKTVDGNKTEIVWNRNQILAEKGKGGTNVYSYGISRINSSKNKSVNHYYVYNGHGDVVQLTGNGSGKNLLKTYEYDAYRNEESKDRNDTNPFRYCGEYFDNETDNIYLRARYYNPRAGRFVTEDPVRDGLNWYGYCGGNPVAFVDPSGLRIFLPNDKKDKNKSIRLKNLNALTDDKLTIDEETNMVKYIVGRKINRYKGTFLLRDLIDSEMTVDFLLDSDATENKGNSCETIYKEAEEGLDTSIVKKYLIILNLDSEASYIMKDYYTEEVSENLSPEYINLGHELVHAYRRIKGIPNNSKYIWYKSYEKNNKTEELVLQFVKDRAEELDTVGITYVNPETGKVVRPSNFRYTENALRKENGIGPRIKY